MTSQAGNKEYSRLRREPPLDFLHQLKMLGGFERRLREVGVFDERGLKLPLDRERTRCDFKLRIV